MLGLLLSTWGDTTIAMISFSAVLVVVAAILMRSKIAVARNELEQLHAERDVLEKELSLAREESTGLKLKNSQLAHLTEQLDRKLNQLSLSQSEIIRKGRMNQLGALVSTVAHELRNPMGSLRISAFSLKRKLTDPTPDAMRLIDRIETGIGRCDAIISQLVDFASDAQPNLAQDDLNAWMARLLNDSADKVHAGIKLHLIIGPNAFEVEFDHLRMRRTVLDLVENAVEAVETKTYRDGKEALIEIEISQTSRGAEIRIRDNGPGMPADILSRVGEPLFTTKSFGAGLGIAGARKVAELHNGNLDVKSDPSWGTQVTLWFPLRKAMAGAAAA